MKRRAFLFGSMVAAVFGRLVPKKAVADRPFYIDRHPDKNNWITRSTHNCPCYGKDVQSNHTTITSVDDDGFTLSWPTHCPFAAPSRPSFRKQEGS